ncbi:hypothetical protein [Pandoraea anhela]|uniref:Uncharacterized protein n=1 Tax=Pandoraea anhela TaxID=2508295 RepID=A0A5E4WKP8_9BURK|nr:hypothetical protein [Pandoraea anhela]VVE23585.1 hypothetical protein PAN31108_03258 [Pandoraea anhela]
MIVNIAENASASLSMADDFKRFSVRIVARAGEMSVLRDRLSGIGRLVDLHTMWIDENWLRSAPGRGQGEDWQDALSIMIASAKQHGWIDEANRLIKAHVEWIGPEIHN